MSNNAAINKSYAIKQLEKSIKYAEELLKVLNKPEDYYNWHKNNIKINQKRIDEIKKEPETNWL